nr:chitobiase/beta-hexosaminidase C-terminal domain-containing protein [Akkermansiaceae bacterium]
MNPRIPILLLLAAAPVAVADYGPPVLETADEFFAYGDFGANGLRSLVVIDRASGGLRQANATSGGGLTMADSIATGASGLSGVAVGRFQFANRDAVAVTSPETNRVKIIALYGVLRDAWPAGVGPRDIVGLPVPGGTAGLDGLAALTVRNHPLGGAFRRDVMNNTSGTLSSWATQTPSLTHTPRRALAVVRQPGDTPRYAELRTEGTSQVFAIHNSQDSALPVLTSCTGVLAGSSVCYGHFNPDHSRSVMVFHVPGEQTIQVSALNTSLQLAAPVSHDLGLRFAWVRPASAGSGLRLIGCDTSGANLRVWRFGTTNVPSLVQTLAAPAGRVWRGVMAAADGGWFAATGVPGRTESLSLQRFTYQGMPQDRFVAGTTYDMAPLRAEELTGDILLFNGRPFFDNFPSLRGRLRTGGWTSNLTVGPAPSGQIESLRETWLGPALGMGNPGTAYLGFTPTGVTHGLANQMQPDASFYSLETPVGLVPDLVLFDPPGGPQATAVTVTLRTNDPAATIRYSLGSTNRWTSYSVPLGPFATDTTIHAYTTDGTIQSSIVSVTYTFPEYPGDLDSDGDGVPDFVETHFGIHPANSLADGDLDGVSDLLEILAGTDPADKDSFPDQAAIQAYTRRFNLSAEPLSHDGAAANATLTLLPCLDPMFPDRLRERTRVTIARADGLLEAEGQARDSGRRVEFRKQGQVVPNPPLFWVAGTPDRFMIAVPEGLVFRHGRGVFRLLDWSAAPLYPLP